MFIVIDYWCVGLVLSEIVMQLGGVWVDLALANLA
jgi:hypothetical protein